MPSRDGASFRVRVYRPEQQSTQPLLYLHGGGFVVGGIDACDHVCRELASRASAVVVSVDYRLAPEHPFPFPLQDCSDAALWLRARAGDLGVDPDLLVVAGDSAGGSSPPPSPCWRATRGPPRGAAAPLPRRRPEPFPPRDRGVRRRRPQHG